MIYYSAIFGVGFAGQGVLNKDPTVWLNGARPANTSISPSSPRNAPMQLHVIPPQKYICKYKKIVVKSAKSYIRIVYNSATILFRNGEWPNIFVLGIVHCQKIWGWVLCLVLILVWCFRCLAIYIWKVQVLVNIVLWHSSLV